MNDFEKKEISAMIDRGEPINISFRFADKEILMKASSIIARLLSKTDHMYLLNTVSTMLREIVVNAQKANAKRIFFIKNDFNINNPEDYKRGMLEFKEKVIGDFESIERDIMGSDFSVDLDFEKLDDSISMKISNNAPILPEEYKRIKLRIEKAKQYNDFTEAYEEVEDDSEGAGLGIVLTILFMKSMGIDPDNFQIKTDGKMTYTSLTIPDQIRPAEIVSRIKTEIINEVNGIPTFPENILYIQRLCNDPDSSIEEIAEKIMLDPALSTDVIKLSNSAGFVPGKRIESVSSAIKTIGLKNVNAVLTASNARRIMDERYSSFEEIWKHCNKVAFYARIISSDYKIRHGAESAFLGGLLHDLGKIILLSTELDLVEKIAETMKNRKMVTTTVLEEISIGISHSTIGGLVAEKWNFPDYLVQSIQYHHAPLSADSNSRDVVFSVYLANIFCGIEDRKYYYHYCEQDVLDRFTLSDERKFTEYHNKLKQKFDEIPE